MGYAERAPETKQDPGKVFRAGLQLLKEKNINDALVAFEHAHNLDPSEPICMSYLGLCMALIRKNVKDAIGLCEAACKDNLYHPEIYHNLGRVYLMRGERKKALRALRNGLRIDEDNVDIRGELRRMGTRRTPPVPFFDRDNLINVHLGRILAKLRLR